MEEEAAGGRRRRPLRWVLVSLLLVGAVIAGLVLWNRSHNQATAEGCEVTPVGGKPITMDLDQGEDAATIAAVTISRGLPERALTIALATALQESKLRNLDGGDRDSVGLFQQRPSQGWGTAQQIQDPVYATNKFLDALVKVRGYAELSLTDAAQAVQHSAYPGAYAKHEAHATALAEALTGRAPGTFSCTVHQFLQIDPGLLTSPSGAATAAATDAATPVAQASPTAQASLVGRQQLTDRLRAEFGRTVTLGPAPAGAADPKVAGTVLALTPDPAANTDTGTDARRQSGWAVAQWAVANAEEVGIGTVRYDGKVWRVDSSAAGWQTQANGAGADQVLITLGMPNAKK
ncbi:hypothetical protein LN042_24690 [Kitasatospora sp. RB6PN24]|uniref:hypothetical protein n=1 Tax=Kitasatospora humi TaxID=2893891 RepID=UPI001E3243B2|nr:hypothetical protein [Kitasatospora humi]MCC9310229.1 hypothetical protein [Kitasatospora humi]